jgi:hypothetical protein
MPTTRSFFQDFLQKHGLELDRMFPAPGELSEQDLNDVTSSLHGLDEHHLAFAITLLSHHSPQRLSPHLTTWLQDRRPGVRMAAERARLRLG